MGRRWNIDPIIKPWEGSYVAFGDNPIYFNDPYGLDKESATEKEKKNGASTPEGAKYSVDGNTRTIGNTTQTLDSSCDCYVTSTSSNDSDGYNWNPSGESNATADVKTVGTSAVLGSNLSPSAPKTRTIASSSKNGKGTELATGAVIAAGQTRIPPIVIAAGVVVTVGVVHDIVTDLPDVWVPTIDDPQAVPTNDPADPYIMLYRGVYNGHPAYPAALTGTAVPGGDILDPTSHNNGNPTDIANSGFTAWSEYPNVAYDMAIRKQTGGVILAKAFKLSYIISLMTNPATASPDKFKQGEIFIPGVVRGAIPVPVPPK